MSIKDYFSNLANKQFNKPKTVQTASILLESSDFIEAKRKQRDRFIPHIDFATASNFAKFGSAELYYDAAFKRIYQEYPYDGTLAEKVEFENSSSYLDQYVFENLYPPDPADTLIQALKNTLSCLEDLILPRME